jgi:hypothetical protein
LSDQGWNISQKGASKYRISQRRLKKFGGIARDEWYTVQFDESWQNHDVARILQQIKIIFQNILQHIRDQGVRETDLIRIHISHIDLIRHGDVTVSLRPLQEMTPEACMDALQCFLQSNDGLKIDEKFEIAAGIIKITRETKRKSPY